MFGICTVLYGSYKPHTATEALKRSWYKLRCAALSIKYTLGFEDSAAVKECKLSHRVIFYIE